MTGPVVSDTGPIIHLSEADVLDILTVFETLHVPTEVYDELEAGGVPEGFDELPVTMHDVGPSSYPTLDPGESAALDLSIELDAILLTDDLDARDVAENEGISVHGSIGVILYAQRIGHVSRAEAIEVIRSLKSDTSLYLSEPLLDHAIRLARQENPDWD